MKMFLITLFFVSCAHNVIGCSLPLAEIGKVTQNSKVLVKGSLIHVNADNSAVVKVGEIYKGECQYQGNLGSSLEIATCIKLFGLTFCQKHTILKTYFQLPLVQNKS